jgi:hypothetical protein
MISTRVHAHVAMLIDCVLSDAELCRIFAEEEELAHMLLSLPSDDEFCRIFAEEEQKQVEVLPWGAAFLLHADAVLYFDDCLEGIVRARRRKDVQSEQAYKLSMVRLVAEDLHFHHGECTLLNTCLVEMEAKGDKRTEMKAAILQRFMLYCSSL